MDDLTSHDYEYDGDDDVDVLIGRTHSTIFS